MSLIIDSSLVRRAGSSARSASGRPSGAPRLQVVRDNHRQRAAPLAAGRRSGQRAGALPPVRLTRRGRIVARVGAFALVILVVLAGVLLLGRPATAGAQVTPIRAEYRMVMPGETLWQIAGEIAPGVDRRRTVARIVELNALPGAGVLAGQEIALPSRPH